jgi:hypothetical protein
MRINFMSWRRARCLERVNWRPSQGKRIEIAWNGTDRADCDKAASATSVRLLLEILDRAMNAVYDGNKRATQRAPDIRCRSGGGASLVSQNYARRVRAGVSYVRVT